MSICVVRKAVCVLGKWIPENDREIGEIMYREALHFINKRFPEGWGGCAVMRTEGGKLLTSVALESFNAAAGLCMETGAMCEAQKLNLKVTHSLCISRDSEEETPQILTACGICQERLRFWGSQVKVAVTNAENEVIFKSLEELSGFYWGEAFDMQ